MQRQRRCVPSRWHASVRMNLEVGDLMDRLPRTEKKVRREKAHNRITLDKVNDYSVNVKASVRMNLEVGGLMDRLPRTEKKSKKRKSAQSDNAGQSKRLFSERKSIRAHELGSRRFDGSFTAH